MFSTATHTVEERRNALERALIAFLDAEAGVIPEPALVDASTSQKTA